VGGEGVAEHVRMDVDAKALALRPLRDEFLHRAWADAVAAFADEQRGVADRRELRALLQPVNDRCHRMLAHGNDATFAAFADAYQARWTVVRMAYAGWNKKQLPENLSRKGFVPIRG